MNTFQVAKSSWSFRFVQRGDGGSIYYHIQKHCVLKAAVGLPRIDGLLVDLVPLPKRLVPPGGDDKAKTVEDAKGAIAYMHDA